MERNTKHNGLVNLLTLLVIGAAGYAVARVTHSVAGQVAASFMGLGVLVAAVSWFQMRLEENERLEKLEFDELARTRGSATLFEAKDAEVFPAQRSREQFERFFVPIFTAFLFIAEAAGAYVLWRVVSASGETAGLREPVVGIFLFCLFFLMLFMLGRFSATLARLENHRLLRPSAAWLLLGAYVFLAVAIGSGFVWGGTAKADHYLALGLCVLLGLMAVETLLSLTLELYRPRVKGKVARPLYDSRLVGLLGQPEGLITTAAQALDYQFGFKVSETWFYRFIERAFGWFILLQVLVLFLSTGLVFIEPGEQALLERFGRRIEGRAVLEPGIHLKWPWPIDRVHRYRTGAIHMFDVGFTPDPKLENSPVVLWSVAHTKEQNFLVANRNPIAGSTNAPPVSLLTVSIPVQFQINDLASWAYNHRDATNLLQSLATREVVRYFVGADLNDVMSQARGEAAQTLRANIQAAADRQKLGVEIVFVGLQDIHPPVKVAPEYEKVIANRHKKQATILAAEADAILTNSLAIANATNLLNQAEARGVQLEISALARAAAFTNQIPAFNAAPSVYVERAKLRTIARAVQKARKVVLFTTNTQDVVVFDFQQTIRPDLLDRLTVQPSK